MDDVRGDVLRPPHGTTPAAVKANENQKWVPLRDLSFKPERKDRVTDPHGGVAIYVKESIIYTRRHDLELALSAYGLK